MKPPSGSGSIRVIFQEKEEAWSVFNVLQFQDVLVILEMNTIANKGETRLVIATGRQDATAREQCYPMESTDVVCMAAIMRIN